MMQNIALFSDDTDLRDLLNALDECEVKYFATELDPEQLPNDIDLAIFDFDLVPLSLLDEWEQFPRLHLRKMAVVSAENLDKVDAVLERLDNYVVRPTTNSKLSFRINQVFSPRELSEYMGIVSSELKMPLTSIKGLAQVMLLQLDSLSKEQLIFFLEQFPNNVNQIVEVIDNTVTWMRVEFARYYPFSATKLVYLIGWAKNDLGQQYVGKEQVLQEFVPENLPSIIVRESAVQFVIYSLLLNASMYSDEGTEVTLGVTTEHGFMVCFVRDEGMGISKEFSSHIFRKWERDRNNLLVQRTRGLGLSLYLCKQIIDMHGGKIWFESEVGVGTTFYFTLQLVE